ncbi:MAG: nuclear transport factor 2 family protein [Defluviitaleaceae bacterium]|nr:nuclear transport factor 2 family protein [Defluviitaleaceae bacterium]
MKRREKIITDYFTSWVRKDSAVIENIFSLEAVYIESWRPAYRNLAEIKKWFSEWNENNTVLQWDIIGFLHQGDICVCEWYFKCECDNNISGFNGVSIVEFDINEKIISLKEFQSKHPNYYPYEK